MIGSLKLSPRLTGFTVERILEREEVTLEIERILGRSVPAKVVPKKSDEVEGESVTMGESSGCVDMGDMMEGEGQGSEEEVEGETGEEMEVGEGGDDKEYVSSS